VNSVSVAKESEVRLAASYLKRHRLRKDEKNCAPIVENEEGGHAHAQGDDSDDYIDQRLS
jgi:hypothetical protein